MAYDGRADIDRRKMFKASDEGRLLYKYKDARNGEK
jgi:hypothetical protein